MKRAIGVISLCVLAAIPLQGGATTTPSSTTAASDHIPAVGETGLTVEQRRARNLRTVMAGLEGYRVGYRTHSFPPIERGISISAPGVTQQIGSWGPMPGTPGDAADAPPVREAEGRLFWRGVPDWRISDVHVVGDENMVIAATKYEGTLKNGEKLATWMTEIYWFDEQGRLTRWFEPHADNTVFDRWARESGYKSFTDGIITEMKALNIPVGLPSQAKEPAAK